jgi:hypothetical protein
MNNNQDKDNAINPDEIYNHQDDDVIDMVDEEENKDKQIINKNKESNDIKEKKSYEGLTNIDKLIETNITDWDYESARNYVIEFIKVANQYKKDYIEKLSELKKWGRRIDLAKENNKIKLVEEAEKQFARLLIEAEHLENEYKKMKMHVDILKEQLAEKNKFIPNKDPTLLLNKLESLLDKSSEEIEIEDKLNEVSLKDKLEKLKGKISKEENKEIGDN